MPAGGWWMAAGGRLRRGTAKGGRMQQAAGWGRLQIGLGCAINCAEIGAEFPCKCGTSESRKAACTSTAGGFFISPSQPIAIGFSWDSLRISSPIQIPIPNSIAILVHIQIPSISALAGPQLRPSRSVNNQQHNGNNNHHLRHFAKLVPQQDVGTALEITEYILLSQVTYAKYSMKMCVTITDQQIILKNYTNYTLSINDLSLNDIFP